MHGAVYHGPNAMHWIASLGNDPAAYHANGILALATNAWFDFLLNLPEAQNIGAEVKRSSSLIHNVPARRPMFDVQ